MRILVLTEGGDGAARVRESREIFDVNEFRLSYTCPNPNCKNEFTFKIEKSEPISEQNPRPKSKPSWTRCPACNVELKTKEKVYPSELLWQAVSLYQAFYDFVCTHATDLPLKLVVTVPDPKAVAPENKAPES
jgi:hypothetical protein